LKRRGWSSQSQLSSLHLELSAPSDKVGLYIIWMINLKIPKVSSRTHSFKPFVVSFHESHMFFVLFWVQLFSVLLGVA